GIVFNSAAVLRCLRDGGRELLWVHNHGRLVLVLRIDVAGDLPVLRTTVILRLPVASKLSRVDMDRDRLVVAGEFSEVLSLSLDGFRVLGWRPPEPQEKLPLPEAAPPRLVTSAAFSPGLSHLWTLEVPRSRAPRLRVVD